MAALQNTCGVKFTNCINAEIRKRVEAKEDFGLKMKIGMWTLLCSEKWKKAVRKKWQNRYTARKWKNVKDFRTLRQTREGTQKSWCLALDSIRKEIQTWIDFALNARYFYINRTKAFVLHLYNKLILCLSLYHTKGQNSEILRSKAN